MKLFKRINSYRIEEAEGAVFGLGKIIAKDYDKDIMGHLLFFSVNIMGKQLLKKLFIPF
jgi:hypothetical protein